MQSRLSLFSEKQHNTNNEPLLVSFRNLVPEIVNTSYLTHSVYYYPAKFIPQVVKYCIDNYTQKGDWIIDPFAGSGTVGLEAYLNQRNSILQDINYLLNHIIPLKITKQKTQLKSSILSEKLEQIFKNQTPFYPQWSSIDYWYEKEVLETLQKYWGGLKQLDNDLYSKLIEAVLVKASKLFSYAEHKTPKLFKSKQKRSFMQDLLKKDWRSELVVYIKTTASEMLKDINQYIKKTQLVDNKVIYYGGIDSASHSLKEDFTLDCVITSPPYLQAQEYIRTVKLDLYWLGYTESQVKEIAKLEIPYRKADRVIETPTLNQVRDNLNIKKLTELVNAYFCCTLKSLDNAIDKLKKGGMICIFVGNPKVDGIEIETWKIFKEYFENNGLTFRTVYEDRIKSRQLFKARNNKNPDGMKSEYLLVMQK